MSLPDAYARYHALNDYEKRCLTAINYWLADKGEPIIQVPAEDTEYHRLFRWPEPDNRLNMPFYPHRFCSLKNHNKIMAKPKVENENKDQKPKRTLIEITQSQYEMIALLEDNGGELTEEIAAQLAINEEQLSDKICAYQEIIASFTSKQELAESQIERLEATAKKCNGNIDRLKYYLLEALKAYGKQDAKGIYRLEAITDDNVVNLSTRKSSSVEITDKDLIPFEYWRVPEVVASPDKTAIKTIIDAGGEVPGATVIEKLSLVIK